MLTEWQTASARNDRERISRVRQVAEDLFKPRQLTIRADAPISAPDAASSAEHQPQRQPRIFAILPQRPISTAKVEAPAEPTVIRSNSVVARTRMPLVLGMALNSQPNSTASGMTSTGCHRGPLRTADPTHGHNTGLSPFARIPRDPYSAICTAGGRARQIPVVLIIVSIALRLP